MDNQLLITTLVVVVRLLLGVTIFRYPLFGVIASISADFFDFGVFWKYNLWGVIDYQLMDKILDLFYLSIAAFTALFWKNVMFKKIALALFTYRLAGIILFELTNERMFLAIFANLFESFFLVYLIYTRWFKYELLFRLSIGLAFTHKIYQELSLHVIKKVPWIGTDLLLGMKFF